MKFYWIFCNSSKSQDSENILNTTALGKTTSHCSAHHIFKVNRVHKKWQASISLLTAIRFHAGLLSSTTINLQLKVAHCRCEYELSVAIIDRLCN